MKILKSQTGFSFTDTLVASVLLGLLALGVIQLSDFQQETVKATSVDLTRYVSILREYISEPQACQQNFVGKIAGQNVPLPFMVNSKGQRVIEVGDLVENGAYRVKSIMIGAFRTSSMRSDIMVEFESVRKINGLSSSQIKHINILTRVSRGAERRITACVDALELSTEELTEELCYDADPSYSGDCNKNFVAVVSEVKRNFCKSSPFLTYDPLTESCSAIDAEKICDGGFVSGYDEQGPLCFYPPVWADSVESKERPARCLADAGEFTWQKSFSTGITVTCSNFSLIDLNDGDTSLVSGGQSFEWGPPFTPKKKPETQGQVKIKCTSNGIEVLESTCVPNCVVRSLNHRFPAGVDKSLQCLTLNSRDAGYQFGTLQDFVLIENGETVRIPAMEDSWVDARCNFDGTVDWSNHYCVPIPFLTGEKK